eukprot:GHVU01021531.1.p3 GENE.GHVU01021531.1~~GHVU01021531.1.p3  ORF type:complete len:130 (+),score=47.80 GHVU01021531.1:56-445(+)
MVSSKNNKHQQVYIPCHIENAVSYNAEKRKEQQGESIGEVAPMTTNEETARKEGDCNEGEVAIEKEKEPSEQKGNATEERAGKKERNEGEETPPEEMRGEEGQAGRNKQEGEEEKKDKGGEAQGEVAVD